MPICPHCETKVDELLSPCPTGDGYFSISDKDFSSFQGDRLLGVLISNRYIITGVIGRGAIGRVYKGRQLGVDRDVVLKIFKLESLLEDELGYNPSKTIVEARSDARERFIREAKVLGQLSHPNCVTIYDFGISDDDALLYIAMEYVAGRSLRRALKMGLKPGATIEVMRQILAAVRQAHAMDIVHRDLKPENIILSFRSESGEPFVKVLDFGIAKLVGKDQDFGDVAKTSVGMLFGTPAYMSPEQCRGATSEIGLAADVYAIGCLFYEFVTGQLPFPGKTPQQMIIMHQEYPVPEIVLRPGMSLPRGVDAFIRKCLAKEPSERYQSAKEALKVLNGLCEGWVPPSDEASESEALQQEELASLRDASRSASGPSVPVDVSRSEASVTMHTARGETFDDLLPDEHVASPRASSPEVVTGSVTRRPRQKKTNQVLILGLVLLIFVLASVGLVYLLYSQL